jgi:hypothetical protein
LFAAVRASFEPAVLPKDREKLYCEFSVSPVSREAGREGQSDLG